MKINFKYWQWFLFSFKGRVNRKAFWIFHLCLLFYISIIHEIILTNFNFQKTPKMASLYSLLPFLWPMLAVQAKRWHDRNKSSLFIFTYFIPFVGLVWSLIEAGMLPGTPGLNKYGPNPIGIAEKLPTEINKVNYAASSIFCALVSLMGLFFINLFLEKPEYLGIKASFANAMTAWLITGINIGIIPVFGVFLGILGISKTSFRLLSVIGVLSNVIIYMIFSWYMEQAMKIYR